MKLPIIVLAVGGGAVALLGVFVFVVLKHRQTTAKNHNVKVKNDSLHNEKLKSDIILNAVEDGVILINSEGIIDSYNPAAERISGWARADSVGLDYRAVIKLVDEHDVPYEPYQHPVARVMADGSKSAKDNHAILLTRNDKRIAVDVTVSPIRDAKATFIGCVGIIRDVSAERTEEKQRAEFVSTASHEMRTPVAAIEGYLALALNDHVAKVDNKAREYLEKAHSSTQLLGKLFQDLLTSAKAEDGRLVNHPIVTEMGEFLETLTDNLRFAAEKKGLFMEYVVGAGMPGNENTKGEKIVRPLYYVHVDPDRLREVISNIFDNAVKYTESGKVSIGLTGNNEVVQLYVRDTGPGIPAEDVSHLFQKFYRVDTSATRTVGGTGLGLFICRKIIELYSGRIWVESELRKGSTFYINLPRLTPQKATELQTEEMSKIPGLAESPKV